ncbi:MAG: BrnT family toxin [Ardenticatenaceae bacterium]|nr:BrnT family toxin [Anaerolineales bacterium]MCB8939756.1 BrnT family toxin [Ardenticatenaceae bacterium]MCB8975160.1 BrnT family toxin [Ardenticatenaceae bacterium]
MDEQIYHQGINFEWDVDKAYANFKKHGVDFQTAVELFFDPFLMALEEKVEEGEMRHHAVGMTPNWQILFVAFVWRGDDIRLISARLATNSEKKRYERG